MLKRVLTPLAILIVAIGIGSALVLNRPEAKQQPRQPPVLLVDTLTATRVPTTFTVTTQGEVAPRTETTLISEVSGQIVAVAPSFVSGGFFKAGELLVRIDPRIYDARLKRAQANVAAAKNAGRDGKRPGRLRTGRLASPERTARRRGLAAGSIKATATTRALRPNWRCANHNSPPPWRNWSPRRRNWSKPEGDLERTSIRAPYSGMIREKLSDIGQYVRTGDPVAKSFAVDYRGSAPAAHPGGPSISRPAQGRRDDCRFP